MFDELFLIYLALAACAMIEIVWTMVLITHSAFISSNFLESQWGRESRRAALSLVGVGIALAARWHVDSGKGAFLPEYFMLSGIDLYLGVAIYSSYVRLRRLGITVQ